MNAHTFTDAEELTVVSALRIAAERYDQHAATLREFPDDDAPHVRAGYERLAVLFDQQATDATALADRIEADDEPETCPGCGAMQDCTPDCEGA